MSYRRVLNLFFMLAVASLACNLGSNPTSVAPTNAVASKTPVNFHNGGVTPEAPTEAAATQEQPTKAPTKSPTKAPKPTATTESQTTGGTCDTFKASTDVYWVTLDKNNKINQTVTSYPDGTTTIAPVFEYDCNPKAFQIVTVFSLDGKQVYSDKETLKATDQHQTYGYPLSAQNGNPIDAGQWGVEFYNAKQLVASGKVTVGGGGTNNGNQGNNGGSTVTVQGTVTAKAGGKPISGAIFAVLNTGVTVQQFVNDNYADADIFSSAKSDSSGQFTLPDPLQRNTEYSLLVVAKGFKAISIDGFVVKDSDPDPLVLDVQLAK